jgi:hypothetical protein
MAGPLAGR